MTQYFDSRAWSEFGLTKQQIRYLDDLTRKLNTVEESATANTDAELLELAQAQANTMQFLLMGA